ncbi:DNA/RNA helicase domain-containing protein [Agromyces sp. NPDC056965]|uniref:DNA/RNA helicase domain-containing protein n=1 Tax=Agromyces sp. NPDC056965 TaxID=3345983 RepID=UPI0036450938
MVYTLNGSRDVYVGESVNLAARMRQHLAAPEKQHLDDVRVILDETFNKSVCLDLESQLIRLLAGDGKYRVLNRNDGITDSDYFDRANYRDKFDEIFEELRAANVFERPVAEIMNSDLFKLSPFKALTPDQAIAMEDILEGLFLDLETDQPSTILVQGDPGTGKTIVAIYLTKLLRDIATIPAPEDLSGDSMFAEFFAEGHRELLEDLRIALVVPQQSLRASIRQVFARTPGLSADMVLSPFQVGESTDPFDILIVDETHRLNQRANQASGVLNAKFTEINLQLFGSDDTSWTQLDWIIAQSRHQLFLLDSAQRVRPADLPTETLNGLVRSTKAKGRVYPLWSQMRVRGGADYVDYVRRILSPEPAVDISYQEFPGYEFRLYDNLLDMCQQLREKDAADGLARLVAGFAWPWRSKKNSKEYDIELDGCHLQWNRTAVDWINSRGAIDEVGSIHTVQGYDLNYAGVIIGPDLRYDPLQRKLIFDRANYHDTKGKENNPRLGIKYDDDDLLRLVSNIYGVLLTRGARGTFVYVCDPDLRNHLRQFIPV